MVHLGPYRKNTNYRPNLAKNFKILLFLYRNQEPLHLNSSMEGKQNIFINSII